MEKEPPNELPFEENDESFSKWFREAAKDKWLKYLNRDEYSSIEEHDAMRNFLVEYGTKEEIQAKLDSFGWNIRAYEALREEIKSRRPDLKLG